jgi:hypothetical protein
MSQMVVGEDGKPVNTLTIFAVEEMWKGTADTTITIQTCGGARGNGLVYSCEESVRFQVGERYLVFATGKRVQANGCSLTALIERSQPALQWLADKPRITGR